jgi:hypothetical protein
MDKWEFANYEERWIDEMERSHRRLELLKEIEWAWVRNSSGFCFFCGRPETQGHSEECKLDKEFRAEVKISNSV